MPDEDRPKQNEACTACRAVKRKCIHESTETCIRCNRLSIPCIYKQERRGRKPGGNSLPKTESPRNSPKPDEEPFLQPTQMLIQQPLPQPPIHLNLPPIGGNYSNFPYDLPRPPLKRPKIELDAPELKKGRIPILTQPSSPSAHSSHSSRQVREPESPPRAIVAGSFSLRKLMSQQTEEAPISVTGKKEDKRPWIADAFSLGEDKRKPTDQRGASGSSVQNTHTDEGKVQYIDLVSASIVPEEVVSTLFDYFYRFMHPISPLLDPHLHTIQYTRQLPILFSAIITICLSNRLPHLYPPALKHTKNLIGQAFANGLATLEIAQAIGLMVYWKDVKDDSGARWLSYSIRVAVELGLGKERSEPILAEDEVVTPEVELRVRELLNRERTFMYLTIHDHRFGTLSEKPRMIPANCVRDTLSWFLEHHPRFPCPGEGNLVVLNEMIRLMDLYSCLVNTRGELPKRNLVEHLESEVNLWTERWTGANQPIGVFPLLPAQRAMIVLFSKVFKFQVKEVQLLLAVSCSTTNKNDIFQSPAVIFNQCVDVALDIVSSDMESMPNNGDMWINIASAAVWLVQNMEGIIAPERTRVLATISTAQETAKRLAVGWESMPAYTERMLEHLLKQCKSSSEDTALTVPRTGYLAASPAMQFDANWTNNSQWSSMNPTSIDLSLQTVTAPAPQPNFQGYNNGFNSMQNFTANPQFFNQMVKPDGTLGDALFYPTGDDQYWRALFPTFLNK